MASWKPASQFRNHGSLVVVSGGVLVCVDGSNVLLTGGFGGWVGTIGSSVDVDCVGVVSVMGVVCSFVVGFTVGSAVVGSGVVGSAVGGPIVSGSCVVGFIVGTAVVGVSVVGAFVVGSAVVGAAVVGSAVVGSGVVGSGVVGSVVGGDVDGVADVVELDDDEKRNCDDVVDCCSVVVDVVDVVVVDVLVVEVLVVYTASQTFSRSPFQYCAPHRQMGLIM